MEQDLGIYNSGAQGDANSHEVRTTRFQFTGSGGEYFSIWIVNLLLSIITFGIYSAWAKVRREQYFHRNTLLDDQPFDYTGDAVRILLGRIVALVVIGGGTMLQEVNVALALGVTAFFALAFPWVMVRSMRFRARNTRYRNLSFQFSGTTAQAFQAYFWIYVVVIPVAVAMIWMGPELREMDAHPNVVDKAEAMRIFGVIGIAFAISTVLFLALWPLYQCRIKAFLHRHLHYGNAQGGFDAQPGQFYGALFRMVGVSVLVLVLFGVIAVLAKTLHQPWLLILVYPLMFLPQAAYTVALTNLTYDHVAMGELRFTSDMQVASYAWLLLSNMLLLLFTLGLAWPWIMVRLARYRLEHMAMVAAPAAVDEIVGVAGENPSAFGEEAAEFLDFDISL